MTQTRNLKHRFRLFSMQSRDNELVLFAIALICLLLFGTVGYSVIEGWNAFDALYMTVITISTVGYMEIHPLSESGRVFTIFLILLGVGMAMALLAGLARVLVEQQLNWIYRKGSMEELIKNLSGHTIFCGYGRLGRIAVGKIAEAGEGVVVIDRSASKADLAIEEGHIAFVGDASEDEVLLKAGVKRAKRLVCLLPSDPDNLYVILSSKEFNPDIFVITRSEEQAGEKRLKRAGADRVLSPYRIGGLKIAEAVLRPHVMQFLDIAVSGTETALEIEEIIIPEDSPVVGQSLKDAELRAKTNINIAAIIDAKGEMFISPAGDTLIEAGSTLIGLGDKKDFKKLEELLLGSKE